MKLLNISPDTKNTYRLNQGEERVFFLLNRSGDITFELADTNAKAFIFAFFIGKDQEKYQLNLIQKHLAPKTLSKALVKTALSGKASFEYAGTIRIEKEAAGSDASQESRSLLLSSEASAITKPNLEIIANDVKCHHVATVSPLNPDQFFYAKSRGLSEEKSQHLLVQGFFAEALEQMTNLGVKRNPLQIELLKATAKIYA